MSKRQAVGENVEFRFPHETEGDSEDLSIDIEGSSAKPVFDKDQPKNDKETGEAPDIEIEIEDDTPPHDRGRSPSAPPEEPTEDELNEYSEKVQKRIKHFTKGYHDERRAKEEALREREAAIQYAQQLRDEVNRLKQYTTKSQEAMLTQAESTLTKDLKAAERAYREAYEAGNTDELLKAQKDLYRVQSQMDRLSIIKSQKPVQSSEPVVKERQESAEPHSSLPQPQRRDERAENWRADNTWFGADEEMTAFALGYHQKLLKQGVDPTSDEYYEKINSRMREVFTDYFGGDGASSQSKRSGPSTVVAPASRTRGPMKVKLTETQVRLAKRMGVPLEEYAKQVAIQKRAERNG